MSIDTLPFSKQIIGNQFLLEFHPLCIKYRPTCQQRTVYWMKDGHIFLVMTLVVYKKNLSVFVLISHSRHTASNPTGNS
jgi:hypothetical protein